MVTLRSFTDFIMVAFSVLGGIVAIIQLVTYLRRFVRNLSRTVRDFLPRITLPNAIQAVNGVHSPFLWNKEVLPIVSIGIVTNFVALTLSSRLTNILYLDMTGTAFVALLLGPWYGAITGLISNSLVNWILYPGAGADLVVFPWSLVNMTGGFFWGYLARTSRLRDYFLSPPHHARDHIKLLFLFGGGCAAMCAPVGTAITLALGKSLTLALDPAVAGALDKLLVAERTALQGLLTPVMHQDTAVYSSQIAINVLQNFARYLPDKTLSFAIAVVMIRFGFPLFEKLLIKQRTQEMVHHGTAWESLLLFVLYFPSALILNSLKEYSPGRFWMLWAAPALISLTVFLLFFIRRHPNDSCSNDKPERLALYQRADSSSRDTESERSLENNLRRAGIFASIIFFIALPFLVPLNQYWRVLFNFVCLVYGFHLVIVLSRISMGQNIYIHMHGSVGNSGDNPNPDEYAHGLSAAPVPSPPNIPRSHA